MRSWLHIGRIGTESPVFTGETQGLLSRGSQVRVLPGVYTNSTAPSRIGPQTPADIENPDCTEQHAICGTSSRMGGVWVAIATQTWVGEEITALRAGGGGSPVAWTLRFLRGVSEGSCRYRFEFGRPAVRKPRRRSKRSPRSQKRSRGIPTQRPQSGSARSLRASLVRRLAAAPRRHTAAGLTERVLARVRRQGARPRCVQSTTALASARVWMFKK
jgi:hypothetical protein